MLLNDSKGIFSGRKSKMNSNVVYDAIGKTYDVTRKPDPEIVQKLEKLLNVQSGGRYLDIGCGSGNYTGALAQAGLNIEGIDVSEEMLSKARKKHPLIQFYQGDAKSLPFQEALFNGATCTLATHHINNNHQVCQEAFRVIKVVGRFVIFTATPEQMSAYWLCHYFPKMMADAAGKMSSFDALEATLKQAGFNTVSQSPFFVSNNLQDWFLHAGKYRPEIYLDQAVRDGISSFHLSADKHELQQGLEQLENDIISGEVKKIIAEYENNIGDYLFVVGEK